MTTNKVIESYPVALDELKAQLNLEDSYTADDALITSYGKASTLEAQAFTGIDIALTNIILVDDVTDENEVTVYESPIVEGSLVIKLDNQVIDPAGYVVTLENHKFIVTLDEAVTGELKLEFKTGFTGLTIPDDLALAIKLKVGYYYDQDRSGVIVGSLKQTESFNHLLTPYINFK